MSGQNVSFDSLLQFATYNGAIPKEGPKIWTQNFNWAAVSSPAVIDFTPLKMAGYVSGIQGIFIDNSGNTQPVTVQASVINLPLEIPGNYQGLFPLFVTNQTKLTISTTGTGKTGLFFLNFPVAAAVWPGINQILSFNGSGGLTVSDGLLDGCVSGTNLNVIDTNLATAISGGKVTVTGALTITQNDSTLTDGSGTITTGGTSQQIFAALATRKYLLIVNDSTGPLWINETTAAVQSQPSIPLAPANANGTGGGVFVMETNIISSGAWNVIGATTGQAFTAKQA